MSAEQRITQSLDRKQHWIVHVTNAYEAWIAYYASKIPSQRQLAPIWNQASGQCPEVRF
jgi:hypothetical protein